MKLNILPPLDPALLPKDYQSPIGWWDVSTEGDVEGRSMKDLGQFYGHVAEIALSVADKCCYSIHFYPSKDKKEIPPNSPVYRAKKRDVQVCLGISSNTWPGKMDAKERTAWFRAWFDTEDVVVEDSTYYCSVVVRLPD